MGVLRCCQFGGASTDGCHLLHSFEEMLLIENDIVPSPDALHYFDWAVRELLIPDVKSPDGCPPLA